MTDEIDFLRAIAADKTDDTVRLAYADWLDENAVSREQPCPACDPHHDDPENPWGTPGHHPERDPASSRHGGGWTNCKRCNGGGRDGPRPGFLIESDGRAERAEFIRVQIALARLNPKTGWSYTRDGDSVEAGRRAAQDDNPTVERLQRQERALARHAASWWGVPCHEGFGKPPAGTFGCVAKRGFVSALTCTTADWLARADAIYWHPQCPRCRGDGAVRVPPPASAYQLSATCPECYGSGENPRPFPATAMPLKLVTLTTTHYLHNAGRPHDDDLWLAAISTATIPGDDEPISRTLRASTISARAKALGEKNWVVAMCDLLWPGIRFTLNRM